MNKILLFLLFISFHSMASFSGHWVNESESQSLTLDLLRTVPTLQVNIVL